MKRIITICSLGILLLFAAIKVKAQTGIGTITPDASAELDVSSTGKGFLPPRMTAVQRTAIPSPANGLMVYDTDSSAYMYFDATGWKKISGTATPGGVSQWTTTSNDIYNNNSGNVGIGTSSPGSKLDVRSNSTPTMPQLKLVEEDDDYARIELQNTNSSSYWHISGYNGATSLDDRLNFYNSNGGDVMSLSGDGRVGVGIAPQIGTKMYIKGGIGSPNPLLVDASSSIPGIVAVNTGAGDGINTTANASGSKALSANSTSGVAGWFSTGASGKPIIAIGGNSGFGVTEPVEKLDVNGAVKIGNTSTTNAGTLRYNGTDFQGYTGGQWVTLTGSPVSTQWTQNGNDLTNANTGNIGIGANPATDSKLDVTSSLAKTINATNTNAAGAAVQATNNTGAAGIFNTTTGTGVMINASNPSAKGLIVSSGQSGFGILNPTEQVDVNGAVRIGSTTTANSGTIRYNGADFEGYDGTSWKSFTATGGSSQWQNNGNDIYYALGGVSVQSPSTGSSITGVASYTSAPNIPAIYGVTFTPSTYGIQGSDQATGTTGIGVHGTSNSGTGVNGNSVSGTGGVFSTMFGSYALLTGNGNVGIGNLTPTAKLDVAGTVKIVDGTQGANKVLTSDANGNASWQTPSGGGGSNQWTTAFNGTSIFQTSIGAGTVEIGTNNPSPDTKVSIYAGSKPNGLYVNAASNADNAITTTFGKINFGINTPTTEKLEVNGAIRIGDASATPPNGTIRYTAANGFEGRTGGAWESFGGGSGITLPYTGIGNTSGATFTLFNSGNGATINSINTGTGAAALLSSANGYGLLVDQGNSGFGIQTPAAKVHVVSASTATTPNVLIQQLGTDYARLMFQNFPPSAGSWTIAAQSTGATANDRMNFYNSNAGDVLQLTGDGKTIINGPLAPSGNAGTTGKVLQSTGPSTAPNWVSPTNSLYNNTFSVTIPLYDVYFTPSGPGATTVPETQFTPAHSFTTSGNAKVIINGNFIVSGSVFGYIHLFIDGVKVLNKDIYFIASGFNYSRNYIVQVGPGSHTIDFRVTTTGNNGSSANPSFISSNSSDKSEFNGFIIPE